MVVEETDITNVINALPIEIASKLDFLLVLIQALGGILMIYVIFILIRSYFLREQTKMLKEMRKDIKSINRKLSIKKKK
jgi:hypothetical protein